MNARLIRTSRRSRLENRSMSHKVLIMTSMLAATAAASLAAGAGAGGAASTTPSGTPGAGGVAVAARRCRRARGNPPRPPRRPDDAARTRLRRDGYQEADAPRRLVPDREPDQDLRRHGSAPAGGGGAAVARRPRRVASCQAWFPAADKITIRQLLNQTSGLFDYEKDPRVLAPYLAGNLAYRWAPRKLVRIAVSHRPLFTPGTRYSYSNTNYILAGLIVEAATGATLERVLDRRLFRPLRLRHTAFQTSPRMPVPDAHGYYVFDKPPAADITGLSPYPWAAGALVANAADVASFYRALLSGRLLNAGSLRALKTTVAEGKGAEMGARYGLGIERYRDALRYRLGPRRQHARLQRLRPLQHERTQAGRALHQPGPEIHAQGPRADVRPATDRRLLQSVDLPRIDEGVGPSGAASRPPSSLPERRRSRTHRLKRKRRSRRRCSRS